MPYDEVGPSSNGVAVVGRDDSYGAIDLAGRLQMPLDYQQVNACQTRYAAAIRTGGDSRLVLISQDNKVIKELGSSTSVKVPDKDNEAR